MAIKGTLVLDIGGLDKEPVDRGMTVRRDGDFMKFSVGDNGFFTGISLDQDEVKRLRAALASGQTNEEEAAEAVATLFDVANRMNGGDGAIVAAITDAVRHQHRTIIQKFWGAVAAAIATYAETGTADERNADSLAWAKKVYPIDRFMRYI